MNSALGARIDGWLARPVQPAVSAMGEMIAREAGALAALFYGSNLRTGDLDGVLDFYVLLPGAPERGIWPRVSYREWQFEGATLRAKVATVTLARFAEAAGGNLLDTTIWTRFCQPCAVVWSASETAARQVRGAIADAVTTAARLAAALGPRQGREDEFWIALFRATYGAEFRVETTGRSRAIIERNPGHFEGLLVPALEAAGMAVAVEGAKISPRIDERERKRILRWWNRRRRLGKPLNLVRLLRASTTFNGAARYAAWKIERHTGIPVEVTPWRERHPVLAAPGVLLSVWREKRKRR